METEPECTTGLPAGHLLRTSEVARMLEVSERAVTDWAHQGRIASLRTPGGQRRYPAEAVLALLASRAAGKHP